MITREDIERVKEAANIEDFIVSSGVSLRNAGANSLKGLCPFHNERSPSFTVRPSHGQWHCFGCNKGGDIITYIQEKEGMDFADAVRLLAHQYNIEITEDNDDDDTSDKRRIIYAINEATASFYKAQYEGLSIDHPARQELVKRDLDMFASSSGVGYAPNEWTSLTEHLQAQGFDDEDLVLAGVANRSEKSGRVFDIFRGRVTWEIRDIQGRVIGFGARKIFEEDNGGKYINTRETLLYKKTHVLYGIDVARARAAKEHRMYVVEGYTDVMALRAAGIHNVVASCGTAFGDAHALMVRRIIGERGQFIFGFDGDKAGMAAARRTFDISVPIQATSKAVSFSGGDPCDIRKELGNSGLLKALESVSPLTEFVLLHEKNLIGNVRDDAENKSLYFKQVAPIIASIKDPIIRDEYVRKVTLWTGTTIDVAKEALRHNVGTVVNRESIPPVPRNDFGTNIIDSPVVSREKQLLALTLQYPENVAPLLRKVNPQFFSDATRPLAENLVQLAEFPETIARANLDMLDDPELAKKLAMQPFSMLERTPSTAGASAERMVKTLITAIERIHKKEQGQLLLSQASRVTHGIDESSSLDLITEIIKEQEKLR